MTPREQRREEKLQAIKDETLAQVIEDGLSNFSIHRLAERLEVTVGALYRYFDSVDHLMMAVQIDVLELFDTYLGEVSERIRERPALERVVILCRAYLALEHLKPEPFRLTGRFVSTPEPLFDDEVARPAMEPTLRLLRRVADPIEEAQRQGLLTEGLGIERAVIAWSSLQGIVERKKLGRLAPALFDFKVLTDATLRTLLMGWGTDETTANKLTRMNVDEKIFTDALAASAND